MLKLNGTAGLFRSGNRQELESNFDLVEHTLDDFNLGIIFETFNRNKDRAFKSPIFSFAWEKERAISEGRRLARRIISQTDILVIIGYSFPETNREVDRDILIDSSRIEKVYLQGHSSDADEVLERLSGVNPSLAEKAIMKPNLNQFYTPIEL